PVPARQNTTAGEALVGHFGGVAMADLHSPGKGANNTPPDRCRRPSHRSDVAGSLAAGRWTKRSGPSKVCNAGFRHDDRGTLSVASTAASAAPTRRDFLYVATGSVA